MTSFLSLIIGSRLGRWIAIALAAVSAAALAVLWLISVGAARERARAAALSLDTLRKRIQTDDDLARLPADERRRRLSRDWGL